MNEVCNKYQRIGLVGGVSWASSAEYYRRLNIIFEGSNELGIILVDLNFKHIREAQELNLLDKERELVADGIRRAVNAGGDIILVCSNTTSRTLCDMKKTGAIILSLIDCIYLHLERKQLKETLLIGTRYTMERDFYRSAIESENRIIHTPQVQDRTKIHSIIYNELCKGKILRESKEWFYNMIERYIEEIPKLDSIILGCTELSLLGVNERISQCAVIDTISVHIECALRLASIEYNPT
ncbi:MAG: amino acid racemase [Mesorhizobium sp.]|nr:MAG: amino acid racemase [Mesorhizobium sp.]TIY11787.1 MAG: amino acid racemase [Mesorhizobium sp.]